MPLWQFGVLAFELPLTLLQRLFCPRQRLTLRSQLDRPALQIRLALVELSFLFVQLGACRRDLRLHRRHHLFKVGKPRQSARYGGDNTGVGGSGLGSDSLVSGPRAVPPDLQTLAADAQFVAVIDPRELDAFAIDERAGATAKVADDRTTADGEQQRMRQRHVGSVYAHIGRMTASHDGHRPRHLDTLSGCFENERRGELHVSGVISRLSGEPCSARKLERYLRRPEAQRIAAMQDRGAHRRSVHEGSGTTVKIANQDRLPGVDDRAVDLGYVRMWNRKTTIPPASNENDWFIRHARGVAVVRHGG